MLKRIISGGQTGADISALIAAKSQGIATGGTMPNGWRTLDGPKPEYAEQFNMAEHEKTAYPPRTFQNAKDSDATIRIAADMNSSGEKCTLKAINQYGKPHFDVHVKNTKLFIVAESEHPKAVAKWIVENNIQTLNVAGNSEKTAPGIGVWVERFIRMVIAEVQKLEGEGTL